MLINNCRVCGNEFFRSPLLKYNNMPKAAQFMPDFNSLSYDKGVDLEVYQCSGCGLVQLNNDPVPYYREVVRASAYSEEMKNFRLKQFGDFVNKFSLQNKNIIEIGCGKGEYLSLLKTSGFNTFGLEFSEESVNYCNKIDLKVSKGYFESEDVLLKDNPFDAFCILSFLEHMPNPNTVLRGIYKNLNDDAIGLIEVPNFNMILKNKLFSEFIGDHLFYFTKETLERCLSLNGFEVIELREIWYNYIISAIVRKRTILDLSEFYNFQKKIKEEITNFISENKNNKIAIWGASHQALAIISLTEIAGSINYVIDSAVFKQGKYTPATHIPIVSPDKLNTEPVDAIIVMAASYSDEVVRIIKEKYNPEMKIVILRDFGLEVL